MLFGNNKALIYIKRNSLEFISSQTEQLSLPPTAFQNLEILDLVVFQKLLKDFFSKLKKKKTILVLSDQVIFQKEEVLGAGEDIEKKYQEFLDTLPLSKEKIASKKVSVGEKIYFLATNKIIYQEVISSLESLDWEIKAVVPEAIFKEVLGIEEINSSAINKFFSQKHLTVGCDFLIDTKEVQTVKKISYKRTFLLVVILSLLLIAGLFLLNLRMQWVDLGLFINNPDKKLPSASITKEITEESSESAIPEATSAAQVNKQDLKVQVLNGSGIAGQAGQIKEQLEGLGFTKIETGNAEESGLTDTVIVFLENVPEEIRDELVQELDKTFVNIETQNNAENPFDIVITTGQTK